ncbi:uracil-DNA glycosylase family protein [Flavobacterium capsici]|uniref:DNA-deoxyinosine glycosylase n=1 Tax=Flavobacterium capsici TaxID=3075618 RepID=A0AA96F0I3_9FLAO|nr:MULTISPECIES: hypothetical protein [unclassified Flavobacterium]WNM20387.1 hypothetical protein RN608_06820 [Flavobacterium sp. PMR2A8]WNM21777.1 hypothetical protein RN605_00120 [Flavobacterium sp. PMTSA4]
MTHKFENHEISKQTKILILGTFHPDISNEADFFYGRSRNYLWRILPLVINNQDLKQSPLENKFEFMKKFNIDFVDVIKKINVPIGQENNYKDTFIDSLVIEWKDIIVEIQNLESLEAVYFTRKTFIGIPNIENEISKIRNHCVKKCIRFCLLETPSRYSNQRKIEGWRNTIIEKTTCL